MRRILLPLALLLVFAVPSRAADWALPAVSAAVAKADAIVIAKVTARKPDAGGRTEHWDVQVEETLKGSAAKELAVEGVAIGDPQGEKSPYPVIADPIAGKQVVIFLQQGKPAATALSRYVVEGNLVVFLGDAENQKWTVADFRRATAELVLLQSAVATPNSPDLVVAACRVALHSGFDEVVWWGASELLKHDVPAGMKAELSAALKSAPEKGKSRAVLEKCLQKAG